MSGADPEFNYVYGNVAFVELQYKHYNISIR
jgi:hypothetical protein